jgi:hypothetical protein
MFMLPTIFAQTALRTSFEFGRIQSETDWILPIAALVVVFVFVVLMYRRDTTELGRVTSALLIVLRLAAFAGLFVVYLQPQWRNERQVIQPSQVHLLVDTSYSMGENDADDSRADPRSGDNRDDRIAAVLAEGNFLDDLRKVHDVSVWRFDQELKRLVELRRTSLDTNEKQKAAKKDAQPEPTSNPDFWKNALAPQGRETRLGQALKQVIIDNRGTPVSAIVVLSDGQQNAGIDATVAANLAAEGGNPIPIFPVGIGSDRPRADVRISDFEAPVRAYGGGDKYQVKGNIQAQGMAGKTVTVELLSQHVTDVAAPGEGVAKIEATEQVILGSDGEVTTVSFQVAPQELGTTRLTLRVKAPPEDRDPKNNERFQNVEIVDRKTKVLLFAGGPSREYQFLRNQLRRDKDVVVDVLLQTITEGSSQDANEILEEFPSTPEALFAYDCIVAFDPDWRELDALQIELVDKWVNEQAGGLIVVAGPIFTDAWVQSAAMAKIRALYPVEFNRRFSVMEDGRYGAKVAWPLEFTRDGLDAPFLWLGDTSTASQDAWSHFKGVYGYYAVRGKKPLTTVYATYSDPAAKTGEQSPIYFAGQRVGSGKVFYMASGEMWRLRAVDGRYFETFYTKLIRDVTETRLRRNSIRGVLLVDRNQYSPGATVDVQAQLKDARLEPLVAPSVTLEVRAPGSPMETVKLLADPSRAGQFRGEFTVRKEGSYQLLLPVPDSNEQLPAAFQVEIPDLERANTERNDEKLKPLAQLTGGAYYVGLNQMLGGASGLEPLAARLRDASRITTVSAAPNRLWDNTWVLAAICGVLCLEWLIRRLVKLA